MYINGRRVTSFNTQVDPTLNENSDMNRSVPHQIGGSQKLDYFDGYMAEVNFIDGQALDPTSFGEFKSGVWIPKDPSGLTYGTNGFRLSFADSSNIGDDTSGNTNDWTANNLVATDVMLDSPTNNFAVLNPLSNAGGTYTEGNLKYVGPSSWRKILGTTGATTGKWYWEVAILNAPQTPRSQGSGYNTFGFSLTSSFSQVAYSLDNEALDLGDNGYYKNFTGSPTDSGSAITNGDVLACAVDLDAGTFTFKKNNVDIVTGSIDSSVDGKVLVPHLRSYNSTYGTMFCNFGQDSSFAGNKTAQGNTDDNGIGDFYYAPPSGYLALCTANLPDPVIDPAQDDVPSDYFNTVLYTGNGSTQSITGVGFQPDLIWGKNRSTTGYHQLFDVIRGVTHNLASNSTDAEGTITSLITSFDSDGFSVGNNTDLNQSSTSIVAWNWLAGNGTSSNTDGSITSTVSVNQKAGFSVVSYTGTGSNATVGHGLGAVPDVIITKNRDTAAIWPVYHSANTSAPETDYLRLNATDATNDTNTVWNDTAPTSSVFSVGTALSVNGSGDAMIAYCFAEVEGYSKFGSYTGNGSTDGPFVYCGFRPSLILTKKTSGTSNWQLLDAARTPINDGGRELLRPNTSDAEISDGNEVDFLSNGFKQRSSDGSVNQSGGTYIFMAFAEMPAKYSLAR